MSAITLRGLGFGDEGKGTIADFLARYYDIKTVVRDNGGPQAAHNVVDQNGRQHVFSQFGSATLVNGTRTYLSDGMLVQPVNLLRENRALARIGIPDAMERIFIDPDCAIVTPLHKMIGQILEISRGRNRFGSVGMGVGQAVLDREENKSLTFRDAIDKTMLARKLETHIEEKIGQAKNLSLLHSKNEELDLTFRQYSRFATFKRLYAFYANFVNRFSGVFREPEDFFSSTDDENLIFEGAQGTLLDPVCGFPPYVTKTRTTAITAKQLIGQYLPNIKSKKIGVIRAAYLTRHGAGVFVTQDPGLTNFLPDSHNRRHRWQGNFRAGWLDLLALRYARDANNGLDSLAVTNLDRVSCLKRIKICTAYLYEGSHPGDLTEFFETGQSRRISAFLPPKTRKNQEKLTSLLFDCRPSEYREFRGWRKSISGIRSFGKLPREAKEFIGFLESEEGLGIPISVISVGERSDQKFMHNPLP